MKAGQIVVCINLSCPWAVKEGVEIGKTYEVAHVNPSSGNIVLKPFSANCTGFILKGDCFEAVSSYPLASYKRIGNLVTEILKL